MNNETAVIPAQAEPVLDRIGGCQPVLKDDIATGVAVDGSNPAHHPSFGAPPQNPSGESSRLGSENNKELDSPCRPSQTGSSKAEPLGCLDGGPKDEIPAFPPQPASCQGTPVAGTTLPNSGACGEKRNNFLNYNNLMSLFAKVENVPLDKEKLPVFLRDYLDLADKVTDASPGAKLTAFLTVIAANIGNRVYMNNIGGRVFCNIWSIIIGPSSVSRKTTVLSLARSTMHPFEESLDKLNIKDYEKETVWMSNVTSAKLLSLLSVNSNRLFFHNEISGFLAELAKNYNQGMKQKITEIFDGVSISNLNMERCERIKNPALSILAASTESWFYPQLGSKTEQLSGFMQRFLYCIISDINIRELNFDWVDTSEHRERFYDYESVYKLFRNLPLSFRLKAGTAALDFRNDIYKDRMIEIYELHNDPIMSYYTRIYDGYWYKFCIIITLFKNAGLLKQAYDTDSLAEFFEAVRVTEETAKEAMYLCDYYFNNTLPLMKMMSEQDKLSGERKLVEILANKFEGRAFHTELMQYAHFDKKEMNAKIETLLDMEVISIETGLRKNNKSSKVYVLDPIILQNMTK